MCHCWFSKGKGELTSVFEFQMEKKLTYGDILVESNLSLILIKDSRAVEIHSSRKDTRIAPKPSHVVYCPSFARSMRFGRSRFLAEIRD